ncbi:MAG: GTP-binding protein [Polyangiaceae bacterium]
MSEERTTIPVIVLTGFLGSGKTTLLEHAIATNALGRVAVVVNEIGELSLDHDLLSTVREDMITLSSGCVCCSMRNDLVRALCELALGRERGTLPPFDRVVVETTGLADPVPLLRTLTHNGLVASRFHLERVVTAVDAVLGSVTLARHPEAQRQVAVADRVVVTKTDLAPMSQATALEAEVRRMCPGVRVAFSSPKARARLGARRSDATAAWSGAGADSPVQTGEIHGVRTASFRFFSPVALAPVRLWVEMMAKLHGEYVLRSKGVFDVRGNRRPVVLHSAQHVVFSLTELPAWEDAPSSRFVLIERGLPDAVWEELCASVAKLAA